MKSICLKDNIFWVGAVDWELRNFHGYLTQRGSSYNAYLIKDEHLTLIDTVKAPFAKEMLERIQSITNPAAIKYVICNHVEMDHSGSIPEIMRMAPTATIVTSPQGAKGLKKHYQTDWPIQVIKSGETLSLGKHQVQFVLTPMVHWPDNMVTYLQKKHILFSNDAFGQHIASSERFDDEYPITTILEEAKKYYANIVLPYGSVVRKALDALSKLDIDLIAPSHGIIWRSHIKQIMEAYTKWTGNKTDERALVIFDTMWGSTAMIAHRMAQVFENNSIPAAKFHLQKNHISDIMTEILTSKYICVGSPTLNNNMLPTVAGFLTYLKGLAPQNRVGMAFGSYGWGGQSIGLIEDTLRDCGFDMLPSLKHQYIPTTEALQEMERTLENAIAAMK